VHSCASLVLAFDERLRSAKRHSPAPRAWWLRRSQRQRRSRRSSRRRRATSRARCSAWSTRSLRFSASGSRRRSSSRRSRPPRRLARRSPRSRAPGLAPGSRSTIDGGAVAVRAASRPASAVSMSCDVRTPAIGSAPSSRPPRRERQSHRSARSCRSPPGTAKPPTISGRPLVGALLRGHRGSWVGTDLVFDYRWLRCGDSHCRTVSIGLTHRLREADRGPRMRLVVTARNSSGSATASSTTTARVR
jgi:hypothetical protein